MDLAERFKQIANKLDRQRRGLDKLDKKQEPTQEPQSKPNQAWQNTPINSPSFEEMKASAWRVAKKYENERKLKIR